jgi:hypothetical protein
MKDKDTYSLQELYENMNNNVDESTAFTKEEYDALVEIGSNLPQEENNKQERIRSEYHIEKGSNMASFRVEGAYSVDTQHETMWEPFSKEIHIEKAAPDLYYMAIGDQSIEVSSFPEVLQYIQDNI